LLIRHDGLATFAKVSLEAVEVVKAGRFVRQKRGIAAVAVDHDRTPECAGDKGSSLLRIGDFERKGKQIG